MRGARETYGRHLVTVIHKGANQQIHVSLSSYRGRRFGDLRLFVLRDGDWIPTQKGFTVEIGHLKDLEKAVSEVRDAADQLSAGLKPCGPLIRQCPHP